MFRLNIKALKNWLPVLILCLGVFAISCGDDEEQPGPAIDCTGSDPSYATDIKPIIDNTCALVGCHVENFLQGDYTTYEGLKANVDNGTVSDRVIQNREMPPEGTTGPTELTEAQIRLINCWIADGAPNN